MADIEKIKEYVFAAVVSRISELQGNLNQNFLDPDLSLAQIRALIPDVVTDDVWKYIFRKLEFVGAYETIHDDIAGNYHKLLPVIVNNIVSLAHKDQSSLIYKYRVIGPDFLSKAIGSLGVEKPHAPDRPPLSKNIVPASDRIVTLNHNEVSEFEERTSEIIECAEKLNQIDDMVGLREVIVGQLRAGRELVRAGSFKLYVLQVTLIDTLTFLAKRYESEAIGALAAALLTALLQNFGISA